ncbi:hypothetical protein NON00_02325 [Roseomonas sp. GC11]|uniref:capsid assembly protein n=1 Tax=Roseomonas sp. GC11 TaxID=2950546 RepID=UPI00210B4FB8|nr:hypothetical protein [Roseomonas sp. GC11]MCQ4158763.1 hypothetical protein [Roseomonas sp. GC11]
MSEVTATFTPPPGSTPEEQQAAQAAAAAKADAGLTPTNPDPSTQTQAPTLIAGKFKTQDDLVAAYKALEAKLGAPKDATPSADLQAPEQPEQATAEDAPQVTPPTPEEHAQAQEQVEAAQKAGKIDMVALDAEFGEHGKLSEETLAKLEADGFPRQMVERYIEGQQALVARQAEEIVGITGGKDGYTAMLQWAAQSLPQAEQAAFDAAVQSRDMAVVKFAVQGLYARFQGANPAEPKLVQARGSAPADTYASWAQVTADMGRPEYQRDPAFRQAVMDKMGRSRL